MARMVEHYLNLLTDALARPDGRIDGLRLLPTPSRGSSSPGAGRGGDATAAGAAEPWPGSRPPRAGVAPGGPDLPAYARTPRSPALFAAQVARDPDAIGAGLR